jgi:hypothetical protein
LPKDIKLSQIYSDVGKTNGTAVLLATLAGQ